MHADWHVFVLGFFIFVEAGVADHLRAIDAFLRVDWDLVAYNALYDVLYLIIVKLIVDHVLHNLLLVFLGLLVVSLLRYAGILG